jgi:hypothetical protein
MIKKTLLVILTIFTGLGVFAQSSSADSVYNQYLDFNLARFQGEEPDKIMELAENLLPHADKLPEKTRISFYFAVGKMYEDNNQHQKALPYYEKVAVAVPDYYVVHRALGYLYLEKVKEIEGKLNAAKADASDETLAIIKTLYKNIKDAKGLNSLDSRLKELSGHCIDILNDK